MAERFRHVAIVGKHQAPGIRPVLEEIAQFLCGQGLEVSLEAEILLQVFLVLKNFLKHANQNAKPFSQKWREVLKSKMLMVRS